MFHVFSKPPALLSTAFVLIFINLARLSEMASRIPSPPDLSPRRCTKRPRNSFMKGETDSKSRKRNRTLEANSDGGTPISQQAGQNTDKSKSRSGEIGEPWRWDGRLVFDIGANLGQSSEQFLKRGWRVVAVEPNPPLVVAMRKRLASYLASGQLRIEQKALGYRWVETKRGKAESGGSRDGARPGTGVGSADSGSRSGPTVSLYVNDEDCEWASLLKPCGWRFNTGTRVIQTPVVDMAGLYSRHGRPACIKVPPPHAQPEAVSLA
jgi:FkbM family methyltransferase